MTKVTLTPTAHSVFNELDRHGLLLGLPRIEEERNASYKRRLLDVLVNQANSTYQGLINGITRELGLEISDTLKITMATDIDGNFLLPFPAVIFKDTKCYLYRDYGELDLLLTLDRFESDGDSFTLAELVDQINTTGYFTAELLEGTNGLLRSMTVFNQSTAAMVPEEDISGKGIKVQLDHNNLVQNTISVRSANLTNRVDTEEELLRSGDYYIDNTSGTLHSYAAPSPGSTIRYQYIQDSMIIKSSPVIIHNLQSGDFKTKMFQQHTDSEGNTVSSLPTSLGADLINELWSVYPINWGQ